MDKYEVLMTKVNRSKETLQEAINKDGNKTVSKGKPNYARVAGELIFKNYSSNNFEY